MALSMNNTDGTQNVIAFSRVDTYKKHLSVFSSDTEIPFKMNIPAPFH